MKKVFDDNIHVEHDKDGRLINYYFDVNIIYSLIRKILLYFGKIRGSKLNEFLESLTEDERDLFVGTYRYYNTVLFNNYSDSFKRVIHFNIHNKKHVMSLYVNPYTGLLISNNSFSLEELYEIFKDDLDEYEEDKLYRAICYRKLDNEIRLGLFSFVYDELSKLYGSRVADDFKEIIYNNYGIDINDIINKKNQLFCCVLKRIDSFAQIH